MDRWISITSERCQVLYLGGDKHKLGVDLIVSERAKKRLVD